MRGSDKEDDAEGSFFFAEDLNSLGFDAEIDSDLRIAF